MGKAGAEDGKKFAGRKLDLHEKSKADLTDLRSMFVRKKEAAIRNIAAIDVKMQEVYPLLI